MSCLTVATMLAGVAGAVIVARLWRSRGLVGADNLMVTPIILSVFLVLLPLLLIPQPSQLVLTVAQASCAASAACIGAYPLAILDQRRIRNLESALFVMACVVAVLAPVLVILYC
jgi:hypothetical protein